MRKPAFLYLPQCFKNRGDAGFIIAAQNRCAVAANDPVFENGLNVAAGFDAIHMSGEHDGRHVLMRRVRSGKIRDEIAAVSAEFLPCIVLVYRAAKLGQAMGQKISYFAFIMCGAANSDEF